MTKVFKPDSAFQEALKMLCIVEMMKCNSRDEFTKFINGFN